MYNIFCSTNNRVDKKKLIKNYPTFIMKYEDEIQTLFCRSRIDGDNLYYIAFDVDGHVYQCNWNVNDTFEKYFSGDEYNNITVIKVDGAEYSYNFKCH